MDLDVCEGQVTSIYENAQSAFVVSVSVLSTLRKFPNFLPMGNFNLHYYRPMVVSLAVGAL